MDKDKICQEDSWEQFRKSGLLWFINSILHLFGWAIAVVLTDGKITDVYPTRVSYRGFHEKDNTEGYAKVTKYLKDNIDELDSEASDKK